KGGLGACVSKADVLATTPEELMYLQGERITVLKHIEDDIYMGYCEGVVGHFNAESVHFVELDPRVLESLDAVVDFTADHHSQYRNSGSSYGTDLIDRPYSSSSDHHAQRNWISKPSFESIGTNSSISMSHIHHSNRSFSTEENIG
ncbi:hypothetical protein BD770DRAFT_317493, partial [Pilaira anomala]